MKKVSVKKLSFLLIWFIAFGMAIPLNLVAKKNKRRLDSEMAQVAIAQQYDDVTGDKATQEHVSVLQQHFDLFKDAVERFRSCLVEGNCSDEERSSVVNMANIMLELSLIAAGIGIVETGEFVTEKIQTLKGAKRGKR